MRPLGLIFSIVAVVFFAATPATAERRLALVVGNSAYLNTPDLVNPKNDAHAIAAALERFGFKVIRGIDLSADDMRRTVRKFAIALQSADVALFYYAGHGLQVNGQNFLVPVDAKLKSSLDLEFEAMNLQVVIELMEQEAKTSLVFLDACRDNPLARTLAQSLGASRSTTIGRGLAITEAGVGTLIAYATSPGNVAFDGVGPHSPFTAALLKHIETPGLEIGRMMRRVRSTVRKMTKKKQTPWDHSSLVGDFYFGSPPMIASARPAVPPKPTTPTYDPWKVESTIWNSIKQSRNPADFENYLKQYPKGAFARWARSRIADLKRNKQIALRPPPPRAKPKPPAKISVESSPRPAPKQATPAPKPPAVPPNKMASLSPQPKVVQPAPQPTAALTEGLNGGEIKSLLIGNTLLRTASRLTKKGFPRTAYLWIYYKNSSTRIIKRYIEKEKPNGEIIEEDDPIVESKWNVVENRMICGTNRWGRKVCRKNVRVEGNSVKMDGVNDSGDRVFEIHKGNVKDL